MKQLLLASFLLCTFLLNRVCSQTAIDSLPTVATATYVWDRPWPAIAVTTPAFFGGATHLIKPFNDINLYVRDNVTEFRNSCFNGSKYHFDNYMQFAPMAAVLTLNLCGVQSRHDTWPLMRRVALGAAIMGATTITVKELVDVQRPDCSTLNSFHSGHTATAFVGAEMLRLEYGHISFWIPFAGYAVSAFTGFMRIYNNRHWLGDVCAGAFVGIVSADLSWWINEKIEQRYYRKHPASLPVDEQPILMQGDL